MCIERNVFANTAVLDDEVQTAAINRFCRNLID